MVKFVLKMFVMVVVLSIFLFFIWDRIEDRWVKPAKKKVENVIEKGRDLIDEIKVDEKIKEQLNKPETKEIKKKDIKKNVNKKPEANVTEEERKRLQELIEERLKKD